MLPADTPHLRFRPMRRDDLDDMAELLGDPEVMAFYPSPKNREQAQAWIAWNQDNYERHGYGLWVVETHDGQFVGDCGLTWQDVNGEPRLEVGYHIRVPRQGHGLATEAAGACRDFARRNTTADRLVAIIHPENLASRRVAEKIGMRRLEDDHGGPLVRTVMGMEL
ncbi:GNAT family N-acetyltransferase [Microbacterium oryzae]|nr:GNAT family N-acetyltransferase [Microbacterium oryzae]